MQNTELELDNTLFADGNARQTAHVHGGNLHEAIKRYGLEGKKIFDFSSNVNPLGPSTTAIRAAKQALALIDRYPDPDMTDLRKTIARYFGVKPGHVICGNGSNELIHLIPRVFRPKKVLVPMPTFTEYAAAVEEAGGKVVPLWLDEREGFRVDPLEMAFALKGMDMAFLCNPNNPTGLLMTRAETAELMGHALQHGVRLVVDEAFMDFIEPESIVKQAVEASQLICLRSFAKFFGMPGLRIGYAVSGEATIAALRAGQEPWTVSIPAEHAAMAALNDWRHIKKTRRVIEKERDRLLSDLRLLPGVEPFPGAANFIFVKIGSFDASLLVQKLGIRGLLVRDCSSFPGLDNGFVRISVRTGRENRRLIKVLRELLARPATGK
ncbi:MAG TPA: threonine-phosphate decarboxylase CobD [Nitrospirota bacterium]|nr:threonine-phosphate decarboxylase CobD [Nitrospirota bacterium]